MRSLGVDLGSVRIGIAVSNSEGTVATPIDVVTRSRSHATDHLAILALAREWEAEVIVIGLPLRLDGAVGPAAAAALVEAEELRATTDLPVETYDERLTTVTAQRSIIEMGLSAQGRKRSVDKIAAAVMLQSWLDHRRAETRDADQEPS